MAFSSSAKRCSILVVEVKSAALKTKNGGRFYFVASINEDKQVKSKSIRCTGVHGPAWNQRFVFSVPRCITLDKDSSVSFKIFRSRKFASDSLVGEAASKIELLFPAEEQGYCESHEEEDSTSSFEGDPRIDEPESDSDSDYSSRSGYKERKPKDEIFELNASVDLPIIKDSATVGSLSIGVTAWQKSSYEGYVKPSRKRVPIFRDFFRVGTLEVKKTTEKNWISLVGAERWGNLAMDYEEFQMCRQIEDRKPPKSIKSLICCGKPSITD